MFVTQFLIQFELDVCQVGVFIDSSQSQFGISDHLRFRASLLGHTEKYLPRVEPESSPNTAGSEPNHFQSQSLFSSYPANSVIRHRTRLSSVLYIAPIKESITTVVDSAAVCSARASLRIVISDWIVSEQNPKLVRLFAVVNPTIDDRKFLEILAGVDAFLRKCKIRLVLRIHVSPRVWVTAVCEFNQQLIERG